jgi:ankyrin repeat protein
MVELIEIMSHGKIDQIRAALKRDPSIAVSINGENCFVHCVARNNTAEALALFVEHGADINTINEDGRSPLHEASDSGNISTAEYLISRGAELNSSDKDGCTPLALALITFSQEGDEIATSLIAAGARVDLLSACFLGNLSQVLDIITKIDSIPAIKPRHDALLFNLFIGDASDISNNDIKDRVEIAVALFKHGLSPRRDLIEGIVNDIICLSPSPKDLFLPVLKAHLN